MHLKKKDVIVEDIQMQCQQEWMYESIYHTRHKCSALEIIDLGLVINKLLKLCCSSYIHYLVSLDTDRLCNAILGIDRYDSAVDKSDIYVRIIKSHALTSYDFFCKNHPTDPEAVSRLPDTHGSFL